MNRVVEIVLVVVFASAAICAATPSLVEIFDALVPLVLVLGLVAAVLRAIWFYTDRR